MWLFINRELLPEDTKDYVGFVYLIENLKTGKKYIGKKLFKFTKTKQVKGKKKRVKVDSDWMSYYGSNKFLAADVEKLGEKWFRRTILHLCKTKAEASYLELKEQIVRGVLIEPNWYNSWIKVRITKNHLKSLCK